jgi:plasmid stabilization system protein ParE
VSAYRVQFHSRARREYAVALVWWRANRPAAPRLLRDEVREARRLLGQHPEAGVVDEEQPEGIRRLLLKRSKYHLFYSVDHGKRQVQVLLLWHAKRHPPRL